MTKAYQRSGGLAAVAAAAAIGLAACGGSSSPHVASLSNSSGNSSGSTTTTLPKGNPTQLLDEWASLHAQPRRSQPGRPDHRRQQGHPHHLPGRRQRQRAGRLRQGIERSVRRLPDRGLHGPAGRQAAPEARPGQAGEVLPVHAGQRHPGLPGPERWRPVLHSITRAATSTRTTRPSRTPPSCAPRSTACRDWVAARPRPGPSRPPPAQDRRADRAATAGRVPSPVVIAGG